LISTNVDAIAAEDIRSLVRNQVAESRTLDYKEELPGSSDEAKKDFLADVSAFANASGGDIIYGVSERRNTAGETTGFPGQVKCLQVNLDAEIRRLESMLQDGIEPRIPGLRIVAIDGFIEGSVLVIRIPKSWNSPHMVTFKNWSRFFARNSAGKYQLDRQLRSDRLAKIIADEMPVDLQARSKVVLHLLPVESLGLGALIDISTLSNRQLNVAPMESGSWNAQYNFDGYCNFSSTSYTQLFRNGCMEAVDASILESRDGQNVIPSYGYEVALVESLEQYLTFYKAMEINPPIVIAVTLLAVKGYQMSSANNFNRFRGLPIDRENLLIPEVIIESYDIQASEVLRPIFNAVCQSCGFSRSLNYDEQGVWRRNG
jgi:hypothetical protein